VLAKSQLEELTPLSEDAAKNQKLVQKLEEALEQKKAIPQFFGEHKKLVLEKRIAEHESKLIQSEHSLRQSSQQVKTLGEHKMQLSNLLTNDKSGQEIERLQLSLQALSEKSSSKTLNAKRYQNLAQKLNFSVKPSVQVFAETLEKIKIKRTQIESQVLVSQEEQYQNKKTTEELHAHLRERLLEVQSLKLRDNRVPSQHIQVRDELAKTLGVSPKTLPFVAELLKVLGTEEKWAGAIEKLLHPFALRMLVPNDLYGSLIKYLGGKQIGLKLVFQNIEVSAYTKAISVSKISPEQLFHKLEFLKSSPYVCWLQEQITQRYDYNCTDDLIAFKKYPKAITSEGLMRHGLYLGEKDDRFAVHDKSRFILGWDNQEKLDDLHKQTQNCQTQLDHALKQNLQITQALQSSQNDLEALRDLEQFQDYSSIDTQSIASEIEDLQKRQASLIASSGNVSKLRKELEMLEKELETAQHQRDTALKENAVAADSITMLQNEKKRLPETTEILTPLITQWIEQRIKKLELSDYDIVERNLFNELEKIIQKAQQERQTLEHALVRKMTHFKTRFSEQSVDLDPTLEGLFEFLELKKTLDIESLPEHERRFKRLLNKSLLNDMAAFKSTLDIGYEQIDETIEQLNQSLREISYSPTTYVELHAVRNKDVEIREFHHLLRACLNDLDADSEAMFDRVKSLLDRLKNEERWCKKVTDVRNWADFSVEEKTQGTHEAKNFYSDSAGLSGGQKAKLAFTILASAIAHQYGTEQEGSFRFIVVDEAFSKSDERNSRYAMELFQSLGLQVMVVTPKDKVHVVEPFIRSMFVTQMATEQERSQVLGVRMP
ncbi:MAG: SbcC/MukB-like Walker B domain-containing protein, partial [Myxococcaceae bacterium]